MDDLPPAKHCPRCGTPIEAPLFGPDQPDVCQACGWGEGREARPEGLIALLQLAFYWLLSVILVGGSYYSLIALEAGLFDALEISPFEFHAAFFGGWLLYAGLAAVLDFKIDFDKIGRFGGLITDPGSLLLLLLAGIFFPGRIVATTITDSWLYYFRRDRRLE